MKTKKIIYWIIFSLFGLSMLSGAMLYFIDYEHSVHEFGELGFPTFIIYPLAVAKIIGIVTLIQRKYQTIREWAYSAFLFNLLLAFGGHFFAQDGEAFGPLLVLSFMLGAYYFDKQLIKSQQKD